MQPVDSVGPPIESVLALSLGPCRERLLANYPVLDDVLAGLTPAIIYPAARMAQEAQEKLRQRGVEILAFGDSNPEAWSAKGTGIPVLHPDEISAMYPNIPVLIASTVHDSVIAETLTRKGCSRVIPVGVLNVALPDVFVSREYANCMEAVSDPANHAFIRRIYDSLADDESRRVYASKLLFDLTLEKSLLDAIRSSDPIYFEQAVHSISSCEVVVDGGAYIGDTLQDFLACSKGSFQSYYAFEPDPANFSKLQKLHAVDGIKVIAVEAGLAAQSGQLRFQKDGSAAAKLLSEDEPGGDTVGVVSLDEFFSDKPGPSFVKMDIEGAESGALRGSATLISRHQPKLAISVYHHASDLWELPALILEINPDYRLFFRHYTREIADTVCYAIPRSAWG